VYQLRPSELKAVAAQMKRIDDLQAAAEGSGGLAMGDEDGGGLPAPELMKCFKLIAEAKMGAVADWLDATVFDESSFELPRKAIVFAHHRSVHDKLGELFRSRVGTHGHVHVTGSTPTSQREGLLQRFKTDPQCRFAILAITACGVGLNLAVADTACFAELCWSPSTLEQALDHETEPHHPWPLWCVSHHHPWSPIIPSSRPRRASTGWAKPPTTSTCTI
jgi:SNF2 family DNA or RNA helicase